MKTVESCVAIRFIDYINCLHVIRVLTRPQHYRPKQLTQSTRFNFIIMMYYVIEGKNKIFATYNKTICYEANMNEENRSEVLTEAKATVFNYAVNQINVHLGIVHEPDIENSNDVFNFLDKSIAD